MSASQLDKIYRAILKIGQFPNQKRFNIRTDKSKPPRGAVFGLVKLRPKDAIIKGTDLYPSKLSFSNKYAELYKLLEELMWEYDPDFKFTSIQVNDNQVCAKHKDTHNVGVSYIIGVGDYQGGEVRLWNKKGDDYEDINIHNKFTCFNGSQLYHQTLPFTGNRYSIIYYIQ